MKFVGLISLGLSLVVLLGGCAGDKDTSQRTPSPEGRKYLLNEEPTGAQDVIAVRGEENDGQEILIVGRIGGSKEPWVQGRAAFSIVDCSLLPCNEKDCDDCPYPWDYCCDTDKLPKSIALVKFVDDAGQLLATGARELFAVKEMQTVVVRGTASRDDNDNLTVLANGMFVRN